MIDDALGRPIKFVLNRLENDVKRVAVLDMSRWLPINVRVFNTALLETDFLHELEIFEDGRRRHIFWAPVGPSSNPTARVGDETIKIGESIEPYLIIIDETKTKHASAGDEIFYFERRDVGLIQDDE